MPGDFTFYGNWWLMIEDLPQEERNEFLGLIVEYAVTGHASVPPQWNEWKLRTFDIIMDILDREDKKNNGRFKKEA